MFIEAHGATEGQKGRPSIGTDLVVFVVVLLI